MVVPVEVAAVVLVSAELELLARVLLVALGRPEPARFTTTSVVLVVVQVRQPRLRTGRLRLPESVERVPL
jgi:hypothetical protein